MISAKFNIPIEELDLRQGHKKLMQFVEALPSFEDAKWYYLPSSEAEGKGNWIPLGDDRCLRAFARDMGDSPLSRQSSKQVFAGVITNARNEASYLEPGRTVIKFRPGTGSVLIRAVEPEVQPEAIYAMVRSMFLGACTQLGATYACCDRPIPPNPDGTPGTTYYGIDHRVFPHREFLGWMGFVDRQLQASDIPEADEVIAIPSKGTFIVSVADLFDVHNRAHVEKAQRVEMRLVDLDALPVTDSRFM